MGRQCHDIPAENHTVDGESYMCDSCPAGYVDDGEQCAGIDYNVLLIKKQTRKPLMKINIKSISIRPKWTWVEVTKLILLN